MTHIGDDWVAGVPVTRWMVAFTHTHVLQDDGRAWRLEWPDGQSYLDQPAILTEAFGVIREEWAKVVKQSGRHA